MDDEKTFLTIITWLAVIGFILVTVRISVGSYLNYKKCGLLSCRGIQTEHTIKLK